MIEEKYLPIGSVVLLENAKKRVMITGFLVNDTSRSETFDYSGCFFPEGTIDPTKTLLFNHSQIVKVFHLGLSDQEEKDFKKVLTDFINKKEDSSTQK